jgi:HK97 family phage major capsid protein
MSKTRELREQHGKLIQEADAIANGEMTAETRSKFDNLMAQADAVSADIKRYEKIEAAASEVRSSRPPDNQINSNTNEDNLGATYRSLFTNTGVKPLHLNEVPAEMRGTVQARNAAYNEALKDYLLNPFGQMKAENRDIISGRTPEFRDLGVGTNSLGGFFVPQGFVYDVEQAMKYYGPMLNTSTIMQTASGQPLPYPTDNDTTNVGSILAEGAQLTSSVDVTIGSITFGAYKFTSGIVKVSVELLQDSAFDITSYVKGKFANRVGRILNTKFTVGAGTTEPKGIITAATAGPTAVGSSGNDGGAGTAANSIGTKDLTELIHSVDPVYRQGAAFMMHDSTLKFVRELLDKQGRPIFQKDFSADTPSTILGYPYFINNDMATIATTNKTVLFGQLSKYLVRQVKDMSIVQLNERFADFGQVAFLAFARYDGNLLDAGTHPVKYLVQG